MKNYVVTVNGNTYEVGVEEIGGVAEVKSVQNSAPLSHLSSCFAQGYIYLYFLSY